ncbi:hypothetical protein SCHPADRAFT_894044 [Schizopora paradoxa]|uniref:DUF6533 domain-containing protein n=1 Tax=Schizopora paradoxa TaxID=27342 RepID=A0A0H2RTP4_9AGAM|nr:hypothetical protein SCHPADRAFT_894044 [Schizopora paradoxa]
MNATTEAVDLARTMLLTLTQFYQYAVAYLVTKDDFVVRRQSYEYLLKIDDEIRYLWNRRLSIGGVLFFLSRYLPFSSALLIYQYATTTNFDTSRCQTFMTTAVCFIFLQMLLTTVVLFTRAYAVWGGSRKVAVALSTYTAAMTAGLCYVLSLYIKGLRPLGIDFVIFLVSESLPAYAILTVLVWDGVGYYICVVAITSANLIILKQTTPAFLSFPLFELRRGNRYVVLRKERLHDKDVSPTVDLQFDSAILNASFEIIKTFRVKKRNGKFQATVHSKFVKTKRLRFEEIMIETMTFNRN